MIRLSGEYADEGSGSSGSTTAIRRPPARAFNERMGTPYPSVEDPAGRFAAELGYVGLPATFVVDADGVIRWAIYGPDRRRHGRAAHRRRARGRRHADGVADG